MNLRTEVAVLYNPDMMSNSIQVMVIRGGHQSISKLMSFRALGSFDTLHFVPRKSPSAKNTTTTMSSKSFESSPSEPGSSRTEDETSKEKLQREEMEYDRRQIRRKLREKLLEREQPSEDDGTLIDLEDDMDHDDVSVYDDAEVFPWKQREAAVQAAAAGGKTDMRMEGVDSLERALMAHTHNIQYGRGKGFAWSKQKKDSKSIAASTAGMMSLGRELTDWESFKKMQSSLSASSLTSTEVSSRDISYQKNKLNKKKKSLTNEQEDVRRTQQRRRHDRLLNSLYILTALGMLLGFAYYIESIKIYSYKTNLPTGYAAMEAEEEAKKKAEAGATSANRRMNSRWSRLGAP